MLLNGKSMKIAIIGTGRMGKALLKTFYHVYPGAVYFAGRDLARAQQVAAELKLNVTVTSMEAALQADIIIPALWFKDLLPWAALYHSVLKDKLLIDITNPFNETFDDFTTDYATSASEELQRFLPETRVVGAFKNTFWAVFDDPVHNGLASDVYLTSDFPEALQTVRMMLTPLPFRIFDAGALKNNRTIERMTLLSRELALKTGNYPRVAFHLWGA